MNRTILWTTLIALGLSGCAIIKTTDVTDAAFKRHQSISVLGWPLYTRITDREEARMGAIAVRSSEDERDSRIRAAEMLGRSIEFEE